MKSFYLVFFQNDREHSQLLTRDSLAWKELAFLLTMSQAQTKRRKNTIRINA